MNSHIHVNTLYIRENVQETGKAVRKSVEWVQKNTDLMLQIAVLALGIFSNDDDVDVFVARLDSRK